MIEEDERRCIHWVVGDDLNWGLFCLFFVMVLLLTNLARWVLSWTMLAHMLKKV